MIEPTDEMKARVEERVQTAMGLAARAVYSPGWWQKIRAEAVDGVLAAVLAIVERDHCLEAKGHVWHPLARDRAIADPCLCGADLGPAWDTTPHQRGSRGCRGAR